MGVSFDGVDLERAFSVYTLGRMTYGAPEKDVELIHVPGRSGDIVIDHKAYHNIIVTYPDCWILDDFPENSKALRNHLLLKGTYCKLEDPRHPDEYRMALYKGPFMPEGVTGAGNVSGFFDLEFICQPQRWIKTEEEMKSFEMTQDDDGFVYYGTLPAAHAGPADLLLRFQAAQGSKVKIDIADTLVTLSGFKSDGSFTFRQEASTGRQYLVESPPGVTIAGDILTVDQGGVYAYYTMRVEGVSAIDYASMATHAYRL